MKKIYLLLLAGLFGTLQANTKPTAGFIENKGQIHDQNFKPNTAVKYLLSIAGMNIQLKQNSFSYDTYTVEQKKTETTRETALTKLKHPAVENIYHFHRVDVEFIGANAQPEIMAEQPSETYYNYYTTGTSEQGATNVRSYEKVTYKNIYPNIDLEFIAKEGKMKYNFILHYGADIGIIKWKYHGANASEIKNNNISISVKQGEFNETIPESYYENKNVQREIKINFKQLESTFGFLCDEKIIINKGERLVIDPILNILWATYFGGTSADFIWFSDLDNLGNIYFVGGSSSTSNIATTGAYQNVYGGGPYDALLFKFNNSGNLIWSTYFGGTDDDFAYGLSIDKFNNIYIGGCTSSTNNISTSSAYQTSYGGGPVDGFLAKFTANGNITWSTYFGKYGDDETYSIKCDTIGNIFLAGYTTSTIGITTAGSYQSTFGGGTGDGFYAKFTPSGNLAYSTYYGGTQDDWIADITTDLKNNLYFGGGTLSSNSIASPGSHQQGYSGSGTDAFIVKFSPNLSRLWASYYGGCGKEYFLGIKCDSLFNMYFAGCTTSTDSIASPGSHQASFSGSGLGNYGDAFLVKFDSSGVRQWGTYYGGNNDENGMCISIRGGNVYFAGVTQSMIQIATPNTFQNNISSPYAEMFLVKFNPLGVRQWGTYIGGFTNDIAYDIVINNLGDIFICGTSDGPFPVTPGAYQTTMKGNVDGVILKFRENPLGTGLTNPDEEIQEIIIYPNPNSGSFTLQTKEDVELEIVNELGQIVKTIKLDGSNNHQTTITGLADGVYCLKDKLSGNVIKNKIVVVK